MTREPARSDYDAVVDFLPPEGMPVSMFGLVKKIYTIEHGVCVPAPAEPLFHDVRDPDLTPRFMRGSDFWPQKLAADVCVRGNAFPEASAPTRRRMVSVQVGSAIKEVLVFGDRKLRWSEGKPVLSEPQCFEEMPLDFDHAYGGVDAQVPVATDGITVEERMRLEFDHPGLYPRNPYGKGFVVMSGPREEIDMPNLENPKHRLTEENVVVGDPRNWYRQPLPWCFEYTTLFQFPRHCWIGGEPWFPMQGDPQQLEEVRRGDLPEEYQKLPLFDQQDTFPLPALQEGSTDMVFLNLAAGTPVSVQGMLPDKEELLFQLPEAPKLELQLESQRESLPPKLINLLVEPNARKVSCTYSVMTDRFPRVFIPGIHGRIPASLIINGDFRVAYETPTPVREQLLAAKSVQ